MQLIPKRSAPHIPLANWDSRSWADILPKRNCVREIPRPASRDTVTPYASSPVPLIRTPVHTCVHDMRQWKPLVRQPSCLERTHIQGVRIASHQHRVVSSPHPSPQRRLLGSRTRRHHHHLMRNSGSQLVLFFRPEPICPSMTGRVVGIDGKTQPSTSGLSP